MRLSSDRHAATKTQRSRTTIWLLLRPASVGLVALWMLCAVMACRAPAPTPTTTPAPTATPAPSLLCVEVLPAGSTVYVNGEVQGHTPLNLSVPAGQHQVRVEHDGYSPLQRAVQLIPGQILLIAETLQDETEPAVELANLAASVIAGHSVAIRARGMDNEGVVLMRMSIDGEQVTEVSAATLEYSWDTGDAAVGTHAVVIEAQDAAGNVGRATGMIEVKAVPTPQPSPTPQPTATTSPSVKVQETTLTLAAYPYESYLGERVDPRYNLSVVWLDRAAYEAANPRPQSRAFKAVVLENDYLKLTFLPELGGRLYQCVFKPTGQGVFYQNTVLKPSYWGPLSRDENWWLAAGGMEWALPVHEHGYEWGLPWEYRIERPSSGASIVLQDSAASDRILAEIRITLPADRAYFVVQPRVTNPTAQPMALQFWLNALLTLGSHSASPNTEFIYPTERMVVHSSGDSALPGERQILSWPIADERDLSRYGNWHNWLGAFVPEVNHNYAGAYNHDTGLGVVRIFPPGLAPGLKLFAFGANFTARSEYADDGSEYFEMWGGPCKTFWPEDEVTIGAGQSLGWSETWLPFHSIGGLDMASTDVVANAEIQGNQVRVGIAASKAQSGLLHMQWNGQAFYQGAVELDPLKPRTILAPLPSETNSPGRLRLRLTDARGKTLLEYESVR